MELSRQEYWSGLPLPAPRDLPDPGIEPRSPALQADSLPSEPPGKSSIIQIKTYTLSSNRSLSLLSLPLHLSSGQTYSFFLSLPCPLYCFRVSWGQRGQSQGTTASGSPRARARAVEGPCAVYMLPLVALCTYIGKFLWDPSVGSLSEPPHCYHPAITAPPLDAPRSWTRTLAPVRSCALGEARLEAPPLFLSAFTPGLPSPKPVALLTVVLSKLGPCRHPLPLPSLLSWLSVAGSSNTLLAASAESDP